MQMSCCTFYYFSTGHMTTTVFLNDDHPFHFKDFLPYHWSNIGELRQCLIYSSSYSYVRQSNYLSQYGDNKTFTVSDKIR